MTERDRRISEQLVRLVQIVFGLVLAQSLLLHRDIVVHPFSAGNWIAALALAAVYITTVLSWIDWHVTMEMRPYNFSFQNTHRFTEQIRLGVDLFIVTVYAYLFTVEELKSRPDEWMGGYLLGFPVIFGAYFLSGIARRRSHGKLATNSTPIIWFGLAYVGLYLAYGRAYIGLGQHSSNWLLWVNAFSIILALGLMVLYRMVRRRIVSRRRKVKAEGLVVGVDVDGVLGNQIDGIIPRVRGRLGIQLQYDDVTEWRLPLGESNIAKEIEAAFEDSDYVIGMPLHPGAREVVDALYAENTIILITARPPQTRPWTLQWLHNHGFTFDELVNVKEQMKSFYRSDILLDDYIGNIKEYLTNTSGTAILLDQPWNRLRRGDLQQWISQQRLYIISNIREAMEIIAMVRAGRVTSRQSQLVG